MKTEFKHVKEILLETLSRGLATHGFFRHPRSQEFSKKTNLGRQGIHVTFIRHKGDFDITVDIALRLDAVEDLVNAGKGFLSPAQKRGTYSLGADLGNITGEGEKRWTIVGIEDIEPVSESVLSSFRTIALPYFNKYSDPRTVLQTLSDKEEVAFIHSPIPVERAMRAISLAFILSDRERFTTISTMMTKLLKAGNDPSLVDFIMLRDQLDRRMAVQG